MKSKRIKIPRELYSIEYLLNEGIIREGVWYRLIYDSGTEILLISS